MRDVEFMPHELNDWKLVEEYSNIILDFKLWVMVRIDDDKMYLVTFRLGESIYRASSYQAARFKTLDRANKYVMDFANDLEKLVETNERFMCKYFG